MNYRPYTKEDKLEVGTKIRLLGREWKIREIDVVQDERMYRINDTGMSDYDTWFALEALTFEIENIPPPHLKIDKRIKKEVNRIITEIAICSFKEKDINSIDFSTVKLIVSYLNSLEEY